MKRASAPSYDLFKLAVTIVLLVILLLMLLRGCATSSAAPSAPTNNLPAAEPAASETSVSLPTSTAEVPASSTPESLVPSSTPTAPEEPTPTPETEADASTATETPTTNAATATPVASQNTVCNTSVPSRLSVGQSAQVVQRLNMRSQPFIAAPILQTNPTNTQVEIMGGPICTPVGDGGYLWWQIRLADGAEGWSAESPLTDATYLLEPLP